MPVYGRFESEPHFSPPLITKSNLHRPVINIVID
uniref:Uncharacterized protein n=1 Tax=Anguilla anguilla TaxID=7936 RepID=A0A0E9V4C2_ANGAN